MWIADVGEGDLGLSTSASSWKVKRLAHNPRVGLVASDRMGVAREGAVSVAATARVVNGSESERVRQAVEAKYGVQFTVAGVMAKVAKLFGKDLGTDTGILITPTA